MQAVRYTDIDELSGHGFTGRAGQLDLHAPDIRPYQLMTADGALFKISSHGSALLYIILHGFHVRCFRLAGHDVQYLPCGVEGGQAGIASSTAMRRRS